MSSFFCVLKNEFEGLKNIGLEVENSLYSSPDLAIIKSRLFAEKLLIEVIKKEEGQEYLLELSQFEKIKRLKEEDILSNNITRDFDEIRIIGNRAVHEGKDSDIEYSVRLHKKLYNITKWFIENYGADYSVQVPLYKAPSLESNKSELDISSLDAIIKKRLETFINLTEKKVIVEEMGIERDSTRTEEDRINDELAMKVLGYQYKDQILEENIEEVNENIELKLTKSVEKKQYEYKFKKLKGSYLLNELSKLSTASKEAVESSNGLNAFKRYLHVERSIQKEFVELVEECNNSDKAELILLCGSVGDGKSHLLSYVNETKAEVFKGFKIHNDATESFDPDATEIETLEKVLMNFSDESIENSSEKLILAINLGVLNNFLDEKAMRKKYSKFFEFVKNSNVFDSKNISSGYKENNFKMVSFGNYNIFELNKDGVSSDYIEELFNKIIKKDINNPFYNSYLKDKEENLKSPVVTNYEILSKSGVIKKITQLLIKIMIKNKKIVGTRELLNFIYEILVPANIESFDMASTSIDYMYEILPNLLFNSLDRNSLLKTINKEDILKLRNEKIDEILIKLSISNNVLEVLKEYLSDDGNQVLKEIMGDIENVNLISVNLKQNIIDTILRIMYLLGNEEISNVFEDKIFNNFIIYLYYFNIGKPKNYIDLFNEVKEAIFNWNGSLKKDYIYLNEHLLNFNVAEKMNLKLSKEGCCAQRDEFKIERFRNNINIAFEVDGKNNHKIIEVDYQLYEKIVNINNGYHPTKNDREEAIIFIEFIEKLVSCGDMDKELLIKDKRSQNIFKLICENNFGEQEFRFERVD